MTNLVTIAAAAISFDLLKAAMMMKCEMVMSMEDKLCML